MDAGGDSDNDDSDSDGEAEVPLLHPHCTSLHPLCTLTVHPSPHHPPPLLGAYPHTPRRADRRRRARRGVLTSAAPFDLGAACNGGVAVRLHGKWGSGSRPGEYFLYIF